MERSFGGAAGLWSLFLWQPLWDPLFWSAATGSAPKPCKNIATLVHHASVRFDAYVEYDLQKLYLDKSRYFEIMARIGRSKFMNGRTAGRCYELNSYLIIDL
jgi:hypothetical protein